MTKRDIPCPACGRLIRWNANICRNCGHFLPPPFKNNQAKAVKSWRTYFSAAVLVAFVMGSATLFYPWFAKGQQEKGALTKPDSLKQVERPAPYDDEIAMRRDVRTNAIYADSGRQAQWIEVSKTAIKSKLRDPESATWRNVRFFSGGGIPIVCGDVNGNNGFGGKAGFERFVAAGNSIDVLETEMSSPSDMDGVWSKYCR